ncbi:MAG: hypothetical protein Q8W51_11525 [Candidatus Palauibacterales bacterium]|nr:hypothetical protein [Candidatus Palauibacterales bacterium]MDP2584936.1 hypothetical protein [Candidatus Palauibacterales bacterium]
MNWIAVGAIGQLVAAGAVVLSLLYLAGQIRHGSRVARVTGGEVLAANLRGFSQPLARDAELNRIWNIGIEGGGELSPSESSRFLHLATQFGKLIESAHLYHASGIMDDGTWAGWHAAARHYFTAPGWKEYWAKRADLYSPAFRAFVDGLSPPAHRVTSGTLWMTASVESGASPGAGMAAADDTQPRESR